MKRLINVKLLSMLILLGASSLGNVWAGNDPSIKGDFRAQIKSSMSQFIDKNTMNGRYYLYDSVDGKLLRMSLKKLHNGIVKKGDFYVSCADFIDQTGRKLDIDFLVRVEDGKYVTTQSIVHSIDGDKRKYHLENI